MLCILSFPINFLPSWTKSVFPPYSCFNNVIFDYLLLLPAIFTDVLMKEGCPEVRFLLWRLFIKKFNSRAEKMKHQIKKVMRNALPHQDSLFLSVCTWFSMCPSLLFSFSHDGSFEIYITIYFLLWKSFVTNFCLKKGEAKRWLHFICS